MHVSDRGAHPRGRPVAVRTSDLVAGLLQPNAYGRPVETVELRQTHISLLFFAGDRVYKVKKPVNLGFLDYTSPAARKHFCDEEVRLNRRLAPETYLGVVEIRRDPDGRIRIGGDGEVVEHAVEMVRLPEERMMSRMLERGEIDNAVLDAITSKLVAFHEHCATGAGVNEHATPDALGRQVEDNFAGIRRFAGTEAEPSRRALSSRLHGHLHAWSIEFLATNRALFDRRVRDGRVREGHGDVHAGNICLRDSGVVIYDCIEFTPRFRCRDVACEIAFLAMDLDLNGYRGFARYLVRRYAELADDSEMLELVDFYKAHLAVVRGKVAALTSVDDGVDEIARAEAHRGAMRSFHLAASYTLPPAIILMCGLPGTGKSAAGKHLARPFEGVVLQSDVVRKELAGLAPADRGGAELGLYSHAFTARTYATLRERAVEALEAGRSVIVDATFASRALRQPLVEAAAGLGVPLVVVEMRATDDVVRARMRSRAGDLAEPSDADWNVYLDAKSRFEPPEEIEPGSRVLIDSPIEPPEALVAAAIDALITLADQRSD